MDRPGLGLPSQRPRRWPRAGSRVLLVLGVLAAHLWVSQELAERLTAWAPGDAPERVAVVFTRQLALSAPPVVAPAPARVAAAAPAPAFAAAPAAPASAPAPEDDTPKGDPPRDEPPAVPEPAPEDPGVAPPVAAGDPSVPELPPAQPDAAPPAAPAPLASASGEAAGQGAGTGFDWPPSARVSYTLHGNYRGEVRGSAQVEWLRVAERYQVHIDVLIGPSFAPLVTRRMSSDGLITPDGLAPRHYHEETRVAFRTRRAQVRFGPDWITLNNGREVPAPPGVQDTASQFVQLTQRLTLNPELLKPGTAIEFPLALPRRQDRWFYDVVGSDDLETPFGRVEAYHLRPRRETKRRDELVADVWFAPRLLYLPVRIVIRQDEENYVDLMISKLPELAAPPAAEVTRETPP